MATSLWLWILACGGGEGLTAAECADGVDQDDNGDVDCDDKGCDEWGVCANPLDGVPQLVINEFVSNNSFGLTDENGEFEDWLEIYNPTPNAVDLAGFSMSDDLALPRKTVFASGVVVPANGYLVLFCDQDVGIANHLSFKLAREGGAVGLFSPDGDVLDQIVYQEQETDTGLARIPDGSTSWRSTVNVTPGASNQE